jgi:hypothetical protein
MSVQSIRSPWIRRPVLLVALVAAPAICLGFGLWQAAKQLYFTVLDVPAAWRGK